MTPQPPPTPGRRGVSVIVIILLVLVGVCLTGAGVVVAIAVPNFLRFNVRAKQAEVRTNLKAAFTAERSFELEHERYSEVVDEVGFAPVTGNLYLYAFSGRAAEPGSRTFIAADPRRNPTMSLEVLERAAPPVLWENVGLRGSCPKHCVLTVVAGANLDDDATIDVWSVSTKDRVIDDVTVPAGTPFNDVDDVTR